MGTNAPELSASNITTSAIAAGAAVSTQSVKAMSVFI
jgi:hypothetical protein